MKVVRLLLATMLWMPLLARVAAGATLTSCGTITSPGAYTLANNLGNPNSNGNCLVIKTGPVTIDLNGYRIVGTTAAGSGAAITDLGVSRSFITVRNGTVQSFATGINLAASQFIDIAGITAAGNFQGMNLGLNANIKDSRVINSGADGIVVNNNCTINGVVTSNNFNSINTGENCLVENTTAIGNHGAGISVGAGSSVINCVASNNGHPNGGHGIIGEATGYLVVNNVANGNTGDGIQVRGKSNVINNVVNSNGTGIDAAAGTGGTVTNNVADDNSSAGIEAACPQNVQQNEADGNNGGTNNYFFSGSGCANRGNL
jgi:hypothetical protein